MSNCRLSFAMTVLLLFQVTATTVLAGEHRAIGDRAAPVDVAGDEASTASEAMLSCIADIDCEDADVCTWDRCVDGWCAFVPNLYGDVDHNEVLNVFDILAILSCLVEQCPPEEFEAADIEPCVPNQVINAMDVLAVLNHIAGFDPCCSGPGPRVSEHGDSGCLDLTEGYPDCGEDVIEYQVRNSDLYVAHRNATYNCCPDDLAISIVGFDPGRLQLWEEEILTMPCDCMCCYDILAVIVDLPPDEYEVEFCWLDWETPGVKCDLQVVVVE